ncbi:hypothetical protein CR201_G0054326, partial [Pongo abelii]
MFWKFDLHTSSHLDTLLEREDLSLPELLDEEDVLQECKVVNRKLLDFLLQPPHLQAMVAWVTQEPPASGEERLRYKYPSVACEILTSDVPQINDALGADESLLNRLYGFLQSTGSLNPLLASFFSKVMGILINRKTDQLVSFLRKKDDFVDLLLQHIGTSAIMDLLLRLLTCVERPQLRQDVVNWLNEEKIVQRLIEQIHRPRMRMQETIEQLLSNMFEGEQSQSVIVSGIQVLLTLLEPRRPRSESMTVNNFFSSVDGQLELLAQGAPGKHCVQCGALHALRPRLSCFHQLLLEPPKDLFFHYVFNNFLHAQVEGCVSTMLSLGPPPDSSPETPIQNPVVKHAILSCSSTAAAAMPPGGADPDVLGGETTVYSEHLLPFVSPGAGAAWVGGWAGAGHPWVQYWLPAVAFTLARSAGGPRKGYMGHLTRVANALVQNTEKGPNAEQLGAAAEGDDEDDRLKEFNFPRRPVLQQAFMDFQMQRMTSAFIDTLWLNDEEFGEQEESVNAPFDRQPTSLLPQCDDEN